MRPTLFVGRVRQ